MTAPASALRGALATLMLALSFPCALQAQLSDMQMRSGSGRSGGGGSAGAMGERNEALETAMAGLCEHIGAVLVPGVSLATTTPVVTVERCVQMRKLIKKIFPGDRTGVTEGTLIFDDNLPGNLAELRRFQQQLLVWAADLAGSGSPRASLDKVKAAAEAMEAAFHPARAGYMVTSPHDPYLPGRGRYRLAASYRYWPFNRRGGSAVPGSHSGVFDTSIDYSLRDDVSLGVTLPLYLLAGAPDGAPDRKKGIGDVVTRLEWWFTQRWAYCLPPVHAGIELQAQFPTGDKAGGSDAGTGLPTGSFRADLKAAFQLKARGIPRIHARIGRQWFENGAGAGVGASPDQTEFVLGMVINTDPWMLGPVKHNLGFWLDVAGTDPSPGRSMWELRAGASYLSWNGREGAGRSPLRHVFTVELHRALTQRGLYSTLSGQLGYTLTF